MEIGSRIAEARKKQNLTQEQLAQLLSVSRQAVSRWESDQAYPETDRILALSEILNVNCDYLLRGVDENKNGLQDTNPITRLLSDTVGKQIKITFYEDAQEHELLGKVCVITSFDGNWANIEYDSKKNTNTKLVPISSILSITFITKEE